MKIEYVTIESSELGHGSELKVYGTGGRPMIVFPSSQGRFFDFENNGMINAIKTFIERELVMAFTVDGIDWQSWFSKSASNEDKARRHQAYDQFLYKEITPFIKEYPGVDKTQKFIATGCSFGGYHSANFFFKYPDIVSSLIALSGVYSVNFSVGDFVNDDVYYNDPLKYLPNLKDEWYLDQYNQSDIVFCVGQGSWEDWMLDQSRQLSAVLGKIGVRHWLDVWGYDVNHDWPWWRRQLPYFLEKILNKEDLPSSISGS